MTGLHDCYAHYTMHVCRSLTFGLLTYFAPNLFCVSRKTVVIANVQVIYLLRLPFDFDTSVSCNMFCLCGLLGPFLFVRHVVSSYIMLALELQGSM